MDEIIVIVLIVSQGRFLTLNMRQEGADKRADGENLGGHKEKMNGVWLWDDAVRRVLRVEEFV